MWCVWGAINFQWTASSYCNAVFEAVFTDASFTWVDRIIVSFETSLRLRHPPLIEKPTTQRKWKDWFAPLADSGLSQIFYQYKGWRWQSDVSKIIDPWKIRFDLMGGPKNPTKIDGWLPPFFCSRWSIIQVRVVSFSLECSNWQQRTDRIEVRKLAFSAVEAFEPQAQMENADPNIESVPSTPSRNALSPSLMSSPPPSIPAIVKRNPRLAVKSLVLENFKSYAGKQVLVASTPFSPIPCYH